MKLSLLRNKYPELGLELELKGNRLILTGYATPDYLVNELKESLMIRGIGIHVQSISTPQVSVDCFETRSGEIEGDIWLYLGGDSYNPEEFKSYAVLSKFEKKYVSKLFVSLNKNVNLL